MSLLKFNFTQFFRFITVATITTSCATLVLAGPSKRIDPERDLSDLGQPSKPLPGGIRSANVDWLIHSLKIENDSVVSVTIRNAGTTPTTAPVVSLAEEKKSPPDANGAILGIGNVLGDFQATGRSAGKVIEITQHPTITKKFLECSQITAEVDINRAYPDKDRSNNKATIKTKCGSTPATMYLGGHRTLP
jgi:hypothetical protein